MPLKEPLRTIDKTGPVDEALQKAGNDLLKSGCPCACICHKRGTLTFVPCKCCQDGNRYWSVEHGCWENMVGKKPEPPALSDNEYPFKPLVLGD